MGPRLRVGRPCGARRCADSAVTCPGAGTPVRMGELGGRGRPRSTGGPGRGRVAATPQVPLRDSLLLFQTPTGLADGFGRGSGPTAALTGTSGETRRFTPVPECPSGEDSPDSGGYGSPVPRSGGFGAAAAILGAIWGPARDLSPACERAAPDVVRGRRPVSGGRPGPAPRGSPRQRSQRHARCGRAHGGRGRPGLRRDRAAPSGAAGRHVGRAVLGERRVDRAAVTRVLDAPRGTGAPGGRPGATASGGRREW